MADNKEYITQQEPMGAIQISEDVVASIATAAAMEVEGVGGMLSGNVSDLVGGKKMAAKGVRIDTDGAVVTISLYLMIRYGFAVAEVAGKVQKAVLAALHDMTGFEIGAVNVFVGGICFD